MTTLQTKGYRFTVTRKSLQIVKYDNSQKDLPLEDMFDLIRFVLKQGEIT